MNKSELFDIIMKCEADGFFVVAVTCDQEAAHQALAKALGIDLQQTYFENPARKGEKIFFFFDAPHIQKNCRNHIVVSSFCFCM